MFALVSLALTALVTLISAAATCSDGILCLSTNAAASSYCTSVLQSYSYFSTPPISTATVTITTGGQATVTSTTIASITITEGPTSTSYATSVVFETVHATATTYVSSAANAKRADCDTSAGLSSLSALAPGALSTACSCISAVPTPSTLTTGRVVTSTVAVSASGTFTTILSGEVRFTVPPFSIIPTTVTSSFFQTRTFTRAAPSFTQVFGPTAGCIDLNPVAKDVLDPSVDETQATLICQGHCAQNPRCSFVYVQETLGNFQPGVHPVYECYYNNHTLVEAVDLECGKSAGIWGLAGGYNAVGRGQ